MHKEMKMTNKAEQSDPEEAVCLKSWGSFIVLDFSDVALSLWSPVL